MSAERYVAPAAAELRKARRSMGAQSPQIFAQTYLPHHFNLSLAPMHPQLFEELRALTERRGSRLAIAAPRGHAKSTVVTLAYALWSVLYGHEHLVVIVSNTAEQAGRLLGHIKQELETNTRLIEDFPELASGRRTPWRANGLRLPNGTMLLSYGTGQNLRGARHQQHRPTLIISDDLEDKDAVVQEEQRIKVAEWFRSTLLKAGTPDTNVVVVGTVLHHDSLLAHLIDPGKSPGWMIRRYQAVESFAARADLWEQWGAIYRGAAKFQEKCGPDAAKAFFHSQRAAMLEGGRVLWPAAYGYDALMEIRIREGEAAFQAEMQNEPLDPDACIFARAKLQFWDDEFSDPAKLIASFEETGEFFGGCDPSLGGDPNRGDYSAIVILYRPCDSDIKYVIAADLARRTPDQTVERILQYAKMYRISNFGVEANQFQQLLVDDLERRARERNLRMPVLAIKNRSGKQQRIAAMEAEVSQGRIRFSRQHQLLMEQLRAFPVAKHDDGPDALEMAVHAAEDGGDFYIVSTFSGETLYDSRYPDRYPRSSEDPMPDRLGDDW